MPEEGRKIRTALFMNGLTQVWLIGRLGEQGIKTDKSELSNTLRGKRMGRKADLILKTSAEILEKYKLAQAANPL